MGRVGRNYWGKNQYKTNTVTNLISSNNNICDEIMIIVR